MNLDDGGRCITAMFRKFHPEHFVCSYCLKQLKKGTFKEQGDKPYCHGCFDRLFGWCHRLTPRSSPASLRPSQPSPCSSSSRVTRQWNSPMRNSLRFGSKGNKWNLQSAQQPINAHGFIIAQRLINDNWLMIHTNQTKAHIHTHNSNNILQTNDFWCSHKKKARKFSLSLSFK